MNSMKYDLRILSRSNAHSSARWSLHDVVREWAAERNPRMGKPREGGKTAAPI